MARITPITKKLILYSDFFMNLDENPVSLDLARNTNEEAVKQSIRNLLLTDKGERPFQPSLGCNIRQMLFDNITPDVIIVMREMVKETLEAYEPRANIIGVDVTSEIDNNAVTIAVVFKVINSSDPVTLVTSLTRVR
jgi:phage baseplate assembly protein W|tara:strand:- start:380 stop:790 length:411 start_codon:yes stop_codon:yes gene_type:complete